MTNKLDLEQRARRIYRRIDELAGFSEMENGLFRPFCCDSAKALNTRILSWAKEDELLAEVDAMANIRLRHPSFEPEHSVLVIGSHLDSVINAGKFDGPLGFLLAYELLDLWNERSGDLPFNLEAVGFSDEEGVRFRTSYLGSRALTGNFPLEWLSRKDHSGISMRNALNRFDADSLELESASIEPGKFLAYYEVHIEQGPVLQRENLPLAFVSDIYGQSRIDLIFEGKAGHAGTVPMDLRRDALAGFSAFHQAMQIYALKRKKDLVATVGCVEVLPGASNVIPETVRCTLDIRSSRENVLEQALLDIQSMARQKAGAFNLACHWMQVQRNRPVHMDEELNGLLREALSACGWEAKSLPSGAGHDAVVISEVAPVAMLFVRCKDGISHHPSEYVSLEDVRTALEVSQVFIEKLCQKYS